MLDGITLGRYIPTGSVVHNLDPRAKIIAVMLLIISILAARQPITYMVITTFIILVIIAAKIPLTAVLRSLRLLWIVLLCGFIFQAFFTPGQALTTLGPLTITREGLLGAGEMLWRLANLITVASLLTYTTTPIKLTAGMEYLLSPLRRFKVPVHELTMMMTIALRFVPTLLEEAQIVMKAQQSRGASFTRGNLWRRAMSLVPLLVPLFAGAFRRAEELATAMEARCYRGGVNRTRMSELVVGRADQVAVTACGVLLIATVVLRFIQV
ncbi:MAG: energy-coupling factor transporter transmembrane component T [Bacillota bacterium]|jgi:energy-coupling factor transport system permease protein